MLFRTCVCMLTALTMLTMICPFENTSTDRFGPIWSESAHHFQIRGKTRMGNFYWWRTWWYDRSTM